MRGKGLIDIYIMEILERYSSIKHRLTQKEITYYLDRDYNITVNRNTLSSYLRELKEQGDVLGERGVYSIRQFTNSEIGILIKSVMYSKALPTKDIQNIVEKLQKLLEPDVRSRFNNVFFISEMNHTDNENVRMVMKNIEEAIEKARKIEIIGCAYDVDGQLKETKTRIVDPYYIVAEKSRLYRLVWKKVPGIRR